MNKALIQKLKTFYKPVDYFHRGLNKLLGIKGHRGWFTSKSVVYFDQSGNDYIAGVIKLGKPAMICKFGTYELWHTIAYYITHKEPTVRNQIDAIRDLVNIEESKTLKPLCSNAGFFPEDINLSEKYAELVLNDFRQVDILASYIRQEKYIASLNKQLITVNLDALYAPFKFRNPWSSCLKGKKIVVVHPFVESIASQYKRRKLLFKDENVLPEFESINFVKAIQSIASNKTGFNNWFDALSSMEKKIDELDYDIALIGCGAYGFNLAAHVKRSGKIAIHLAGWTQMLFGIYGNRWIENPEYNKFINEYWIRPLESEKPRNAEIIENSCYW